MDTLKEDIRLARDLIYEGAYHQFDSMYSFCNENIKELFSYFNLQDKTCLSVMGGGDQVLDMFLRGAKFITAFDLNPLTKYYFDLKLAFLKSGLSFDLYKDFFCFESYYNVSINYHAFNQNTFDKIKNYLSKDAYIFWNMLYLNYDPINIRKPIGLFNYDEPGVETLEKSLFYFNKDNFELLKKMAKNIKIDFLCSDIKTLYYELTTNYDFMYFSNIMAYADFIFPHSKENGFSKFESNLRCLSKNLTDKGIMLAGYIFMYDEVKSELLLQEEYKKIFVKSMSMLKSETVLSDVKISQDATLLLKKRDI